MRSMLGLSAFVFVFALAAAAMGPAAMAIEQPHGIISPAVLNRTTPAERGELAACVKEVFRACPAPSCPAGTAADVEKCLRPHSECQGTRLRGCATQVLGARAFVD